MRPLAHRRAAPGPGDVSSGEAILQEVECEGLVGQSRENSSNGAPGLRRPAPGARRSQALL
jgi:hypothetical protein